MYKHYRNGSKEGQGLIYFNIGLDPAHIQDLSLKVHRESLMICESRERQVLTFCQKVVIFVLIKSASYHKYGTDLESRVPRYAIWVLVSHYCITYISLSTLQSSFKPYQYGGVFFCCETWIVACIHVKEIKIHCFFCIQER